MPLWLLVERDRGDKRGGCVRAMVDADVRGGLLLPSRHCNGRCCLRGLRSQQLHLDELNERLELRGLLVGPDVRRGAAPAGLHDDQRRQLHVVRGRHL